eukprot:Opistho-2@34593
MPIVRQLELKARMVGSLNSDDVRAEVGTKEEAERLDDIGPLGLVSRQRNLRKLLVGAKHHKLRSKDDARLLLLVVVNLDAGVVGHAVCDHARLVAGLGDGGALAAVAAVSEGVPARREQGVDGRRQLLDPQLLVLVQHVRQTAHGAHLARLDVAHVNALVFIERNCLALLDDLRLHGRHILDRAADHPAVAGAATNLRSGDILVKGVQSAEDKALVVAENIDVLDAGLEALTGTQEERRLSADELLLSKLRLAIGAHGVHNDGVMAVSESGNIDHTDHLFIYRRNVRLRVRQRDQPLLSVLAWIAKVVRERAECAHVKRLLVGEHIRLHNVHDLLVDAGEIRTHALHRPLFARHAAGSLAVNTVLARTETKGSVGLDDGGADGLNHLHLHLRDVRSRSLKKPLVAGVVLCAVVIKVADGTKSECGIGGNNEQSRHLANDVLAGVEREGVAGEADFLVAVAQLGLPALLKHRVALGVHKHGILHHAVAARRHCDHLLGAIDDFLVVLTNERLGSDLNACDVLVLVEHVQIKVRRDAVQILGGLVSLVGARHFHKVRSCSRGKRVFVLVVFPDFNDRKLFPFRRSLLNSCLGPRCVPCTLR